MSSIGHPLVPAISLHRGFKRRRSSDLRRSRAAWLFCFGGGGGEEEEEEMCGGGEEEEEERCGVGGGGGRLLGTGSNGAFWVFGKNLSVIYAAPLEKMVGTNECPTNDIVGD